MANLTKCTVPTDVIGSLGTTPDERAITTQEFKDKFDEMSEGIVEYINETLTPELDTKFSSIDTNINALYNDSMARQAIIDGNFQIAQANPVVGTEVINPASGTYPVFDMWKIFYSADGGTLPTTIKFSQEKLASGELPNSYFCKRLSSNSAGTSLGANSYYIDKYYIENGTRNLCGNGKKVTLSFYAKSTIANKRIGVRLLQTYGTGGTVSPVEIIKGSAFTLTSTLTKYTVTFTTNTLEGKVFGTNNDDSLQLDFLYMWGSSLASDLNTVTAETFVGGFSLDIAQVQLCAGDVALPFMPKSFDEELNSCQRYFQKSYKYTDLIGSSANAVGMISKIAANTNDFYTPNERLFKKMRVPPAVKLYGYNSGAVGGFNPLFSSTLTVLNATYISDIGFQILGSGSNLTKDTQYGGHFTADARF